MRCDDYNSPYVSIACGIKANRVDPCHGLEKAYLKSIKIGTHFNMKMAKNKGADQC